MAVSGIEPKPTGSQALLVSDYFQSDEAKSSIRHADKNHSSKKPPCSQSCNSVIEASWLSIQDTDTRHCAIHFRRCHAEHLADCLDLQMFYR